MMVMVMTMMTYIYDAHSYICRCLLLITTTASLARLPQLIDYATLPCQPPDDRRVFLGVSAAAAAAAASDVATGGDIV